MELLGISVTQLAKEIHIDRTGISKWLSGVRPFHEKNPHYEATLQYLFLVNKQQNQQTLERFFATIYPFETTDEFFLRRCMDQFLSAHQAIPQGAFEMASEVQSCLYYSHIPVFNDVAGRYSALLQALNAVECSASTETLFLFDNEQFFWLVSNPTYAQTFVDKLSHIIKAGHLVCFIFNSYDIASFKKYSNLVYHLCAYENTREYYFKSILNTKAFLSCYLVKNQMAVTGNCASFKNNEMYTTIYKDPCTVNSMEYLLTEVLKQCTMAKAVRTTAERIDLFNKLTKYEVIEDITYLFTPTLSFITMGRELMIEIFNENKIYGEFRNQLIAFFDAVEMSRNKKSLIPLRRHLCHYDTLKQQLSQENILFKEISVICGKDIYISNGQFRQHLRDTAHLLINHTNYCLGLMNFNGIAFRKLDDYSCRIKKNVYHVFCHRILKYVEETNVVNASFSEIDDFWMNYIPAVCKNNREVAQILLQLAEQ